MNASIARPATRPIPLNDISRYTALRRDDLAAVARDVIQSGHYVLGPHVARFERLFAEYCGVGQCIGVGNGTDALELALRAVGVSEGDRVATAANAAMYSTNAILAIGARPWFVDVREDGLVDASTVAAALDSSDAPPRAVIITHLYGRLADVEAVGRVLGTIPLVEDCAQAHGARDPRGRRAGSFGAAAAFSFYPTKNLGALGDGGAVLTSDSATAERARALRQYGWDRKYHNRVPGGRNSRLDELQAALLCVMLKDLDSRNARRRQVATIYSERIVHPQIHVPGGFDESNVAHLFVVRSTRRDDLAAHLLRRGVATDVHYPVPDYGQPTCPPDCGGPLPGIEAACAMSLTLPCFPELHDDEIDAVVEACNSWRPE